MLNFAQLTILLASAICMSAAAPPMAIPATGPPGSSDKDCHVYKGPQGTNTVKLNPVGDLFPNSYTDGIDDGTRVVYDKEHNQISITTGKKSLSENLVSIAFNTHDPTALRSHYVLRLLRDDYCSMTLKTTVPASAEIIVSKGPVPPTPRVRGGLCTKYTGPKDAAALKLTQKDGLVWTDGNKNGQGTQVRYDSTSKKMTITAGKEAKDNTLVWFDVSATYSNGMGATTGTGIRMRNDDSCTVIATEPLAGLTKSYSVTVGTPASYY